MDQFLRVGATIDVFDSAALAALDATGLTPGTVVYVTSLAKDFTLILSDAALSPDQIVAVNGVSGYRWEVGTAGSGPWLSGTKFYVSPLGDDANDGKSETAPVRHIYNGLLAVKANGGGVLYVDDQCEVGGPVSNQGIRIRSDFGIPDFGADLGWVSFGVPLTIIGRGTGNGGGPFAQPNSAIIGGGGDSRGNPPLWIAGANAMLPIAIEGLQWAAPTETGPRIGVDYDYDPVTFQVVNIPVASASRAGNATTYTVTLPTGYQVTSASRLSGITTLTIPNPGVPHPPWRAPFADPGAWTQNVPIRFTSGSPGSFPSIDVYLSATSVPLQHNDIWTISYSDPGPDVSDTPITGTVQTHGCCPAEFGDLTSTDDNFLGTMYQVTAATVDTIVVEDFNNQSGDQTGIDIGTFAHSERYTSGTTNVRLKNISWQIDQTSPSAGPGWDIGHTHAWRPEIEGGTMTGFAGTPEVFAPYRDIYRMAAMFCYGGESNGGVPVSAFYLHDGMGAGGSIVALANSSSVAHFDARRMIFEPGASTAGFPLLHVQGNDTNTTVYAADLASADQIGFSVILTGVQPTAATIERCGLVSGPCIGGNTYDDQPGVWIGPSNTLPPWAYGHIQPWADGRLAGKHPAAVRGMGVLGARFTNFVPASSTWVLGGHTTLTTGILAPDGSLTADQLSTTLADNELLASAADGATWTSGGKFYVCGWVNALPPSSSIIQSELFRLDATGVVWDESGSSTVHIPWPYAGTGWQFVSGYVTVRSTSSTTPTIQLRTIVQTGQTIQFWGLNAAYIPTDIDDNDAFEHLGTLRHQPRYLVPGMSGTMEGTKLVGHGGLGTAARYVVGVGSGQLTLGGVNGNAIEVFDESGNSLGYVVLQSGTVNP